MSTDLDSLKRRLHRMVEREKLTQIACDLVNIPNPTGYEKPCADYILGRYQAAGIKVLPRVFEDQRSNAFGIMKGDGSGPTPVLNGHLAPMRVRLASIRAVQSLSPCNRKFNRDASEHNRCLRQCMPSMKGTSP